MRRGNLLTIFLAGAFLALFSISIISCNDKVDDVPFTIPVGQDNNPNPNPDPGDNGGGDNNGGEDDNGGNDNVTGLVEGVWGFESIQLGVDVPPEALGINPDNLFYESAKILLGKGSNIIGDDFIAALGGIDKDLQTAFMALKENQYSFNFDGTYTVDGFTGLLWPEAGTGGNWTLNEDSTVLVLKNPDDELDIKVVELGASAIVLEGSIKIEGQALPLVVNLKRTGDVEQPAGLNLYLPGKWKFDGILLAVDVPPEALGIAPDDLFYGSAKILLSKGSNIIGNDFIAALGGIDKDLQTAFNAFKDNIYTFSRNHSYTVDGFSGVVWAKAGDAGTWTVSEEVLTLSNAEDPSSQENLTVEQADASEIVLDSSIPLAGQDLPLEIHLVPAD